jgi:hypothetical protein
VGTWCVRWLGGECAIERYMSESGAERCVWGSGYMNVCGEACYVHGCSVVCCVGVVLYDVCVCVCVCGMLKSKDRL